MTFPTLVKFLDLHGYLYVTGTTYILAILIIWIFIPETKVRSAHYCVGIIICLSTERILIVSVHSLSGI